MSSTKTAAKPAAKKPAVKRAARKPVAGAAKAVVAAATGDVAGVQRVALDAIDPTHFANPRGDVDTSSDAFEAFTEQIKRRGVLQGIALLPLKDGKYAIVWGWRRYHASIAAGLTDIPVGKLYASDTEARDALVDAIAENAAREDMSPLAEARAIDQLMREHKMRQVDAGAVIGMSERTVRERLRLLKIHTEAPVVAEAISSGAVPMDAAVTLQHVAKTSPEVAEAIVAAVNESDEDGWSGSNLVDQRGVMEVLEHVVDTAAVLVTGRYIGYGDYVKDAIAELNMTPEQETRWAKLKTSHNPHDRETIRFDEHAWKIAADAGALLELTHHDEYGRGDTRRYLTDRGVLGAMVDDALARMEQSAADRAAEERKRKAADAKTAAKTGKTQVEVEAARKEREREAKKREQAHHANVELGARADAKAMAAAALSLDGAKALALVILETQGASMLNRGMRYTDPAHLTEEAKKDGSVKRTYKLAPSSGDVENALVQEVLAAKTAGEALGVAMRAMLLGRAADEAVVPQSGRSWWTIPGYDGGPVAKHLDATLKAIGLTEGLADAAKKRAIQKAAVTHGLVPAPKLTGNSKKAYELVKARPGITIPELADAMSIKQNYLYRVMPELQKDGLITKTGRGWHPVEATA